MPNNLVADSCDIAAFTTDQSLPNQPPDEGLDALDTRISLIPPALV